MPAVERRKAYKARDPLTTIHQIRGILADQDLFTVEDHCTYEVPGVHCCRVAFGDDDIVGLDVGTNGKGLNRRYALASAYGEFMERLQNGVLFPIRQLKFATRRYLDRNAEGSVFEKRLEAEELVLDFHFGPDERFLGPDALVEECSEELASLLRLPDPGAQKDLLDRIFQGDQVACLPYYAVRAGRVRLLPTKLVWNCCGTNGMCAGNTPQEALNQGISEIFERYAIRSIFLEGMTPPDVPLDVFEGQEIHRRLTRLEEKSRMIVRVKDCSLGMGLPVMGLLLVNPTTKKYTFHLGADPSPITALERCLTEIYQGTFAALQARFHPLPEEGAVDDGKGGMEGSAPLRAAYYANTLSGAGAWPTSLFSPNPSYPFDGFQHPVSESDSDDLTYLLGILDGLERELFIRDVSYLGIPAFQLYVPGMSETDFLFDGSELENWMAIVRAHRTILDLPGADRAAREVLASQVARTRELALPASFQPQRWFLSNGQAELNGLSRDYFLTLLYASLGEFRRAASLMEEVLDAAETGSSPLLYLRGVRDFLSGKAEGLESNALRSRLEGQVGAGVAERVMTEFEDPGPSLFQRLSFPTCFACDRCPVEDDCLFLNVLRRVKPLQDLQASNLPDQAGIAAILPS